MKRSIDQIKNKTFDLLIVGGGINGCAIAHLAALGGLRVCLIEKHDFAWGTSSRSTKLLHGGIRYLENFEFDLVSEALRERYIQWQSVPYLVKPLPFVVPVYKNDKRPLWMMAIGVWLYDLLSGKYRIGRHRLLSVDEVVSLAAGINRTNLVGGVEYYDAQMDDSRIVLENALMADHYGAQLANYVEAKDFIKEGHHIVGVNAVDTMTGEEFTIKAATTIVTTGPWADQLRQKDVANVTLRIRQTKGSHLVYRGQIAPTAFLIQSKQDNRIFFIIPFHGNTLIGTTDTDYKGDVDSVTCSDEDIAYLLNEAQRIFPHIHFDKDKIITTFAGVRPLVLNHASGQGPSAVSRKHVIEKSSTGVWYVMGGKYTTYRAMAEETVLKACPQLKGKINSGHQFTLFGSGAVNQELKLLRHRYGGISIETIRYLISVYGSRFDDVLKLTLTDPSLAEPLYEGGHAIKAQVIYSRDIEMALSAEDIFERRLNLAYNDCPRDKCYTTIETLLRKV